MGIKKDTCLYGHVGCKIYVRKLRCFHKKLIYWNVIDLLKQN